MSTAFQVGDHVRIGSGPKSLPGIITEDRGPTGMRGRRLYSVAVPMDPFEPSSFIVAEDELQPDIAQPPLVQEKVIEYLTHGGLVGILQSGRGGPTPPRVWLRPDSLGNVTHTFVEERGEVGGAVVPYPVLKGDRIRAEKRTEVLTFLQQFGLDRDQAKRVLSAIKTST